MFSNPSSPRDTNNPNVQVKNPQIVKNIVFTSFPPCFSTQVRFFAQRIKYSWFCIGRQRSTRGIRASDPEAPSLNCLVVNPLGIPKIRNPQTKIQNPESKIPNSPIQNPKSKFFSPGFWGFWILDRYVTAPNFRFSRGILDFGFRMSDFGFRILIASLTCKKIGKQVTPNLDLASWNLAKAVLRQGREVQLPQSVSPGTWGHGMIAWGWYLVHPNWCIRSLYRLCKSL